MPITFVQSASTKTNSGSVGSLNVSYASNVVSGNAAFAIVHYYNSAVTVTMTDTRTGTGWTEVGTAVNQGSAITSHIFYGTFASSGSCSVTATFSSATSYGGLAIFEYSGFGTLALQGTGQSAKANSTAPSLTFTTTQANTLVIVGYLSNAGGSASFTGATIRERTNFSTLFQSNQANEDINTSAASQAYSTTQSSGHWILHAGEFYDSGGGAITGTGAATLGAVTSSGSSTLSIAGSGARTLAAATSAGAGTVGITATGAATLGAVTSAGAGSPAITGSGGATLGAVTGTGAGSIGASGSGTATLGTVTASATGTLAITSTGAKTLGAVTSTGAGTLPITGAGAATLGAITAAGTGGSGAAGAGAVTLGAVTATGAGTLGIAGTGAKTIGAVTAAGVGTLSIAGALAKTLGAVTCIATESSGATTLAVLVGTVTHLDPARTTRNLDPARTVAHLDPVRKVRHLQ